MRRIADRVKKSHLTPPSEMAHEGGYEGGGLEAKRAAYEEGLINVERGGGGEILNFKNDERPWREGRVGPAA
jgi:hypothetical protein